MVDKKDFEIASEFKGLRQTNGRDPMQPYYDKFSTKAKINPPMVSANEGFHVASLEFEAAYVKAGHMQFDIERPDTWRCPDGRVLNPKLVKFDKK